MSFDSENKLASDIDMLHDITHITHMCIMENVNDSISCSSIVHSSSIPELFLQPENQASSLLHGIGLCYGHAARAAEIFSKP